MSPSPFALLTHDLVLLPTPWSVEVEEYRALFRKLHADATFCHVAFGHHFGPVVWSDDEVRSLLLNRDGALRWAVRGMGDFALGVLPIDNNTGKTAFHTLPGRLLKKVDEEVRIIEGEDFETLSKLFSQVVWAGYTCVRDATTAGGYTTELYSKGDATGLPEWQEMIEMRYGMDADFRGRGLATRATKAVMDWAVEEHGVKRFIAETLNTNTGSQKLLGRLGFEKTDTNYFGHAPSETVEWAKVAV